MGKHRILSLAACALLSACGESDPSVRGQNVDGGVFFPPPPRGEPDAPGCEQVAFYDDRDGDGFGDSATVETSCEPPNGATLRGDDCDDGDALTSPLAPELCDGADNDCDGAIDDAVEEREFFADGDGDGFGDADETVRGCMPPDGFAVSDGDCDDASSAISPAMSEVCDGVDQDCDDGIDEGALRVSATSEPIGTALGGMRNLAITTIEGAYVAVWVDLDHRFVAQELDGHGAAVGEPHALFEPSLPRATIYSPAAVAIDRTLLVAWGDEAGTFARTVSLDTWTASAPMTISSRRGMPVAAVALGEEAAVLWQERNAFDETYLVRVDVAGGTTLGSPVRLREQNVTSPDLFGASAIAIDDRTILLGVIDRRPEEDVPSAFVHRIQVAPSVVLDESPSQLVLPEGVAPSRILLAGAPSDESVIAAVSWGRGADARTRMWRLLPNATGALHGADALGEEIEGFAVGAASGPGGGDVLMLEEGALERDVLSLLHQPVALPRWSAVGTSVPLEGVWGSVSARSGLAGVFVATGRVSETDVDADLWAVPYGCFPT